MAKTELKIIEKIISGSICIIVNSQYNNLNAVNVTIEKNLTVRLFGIIKRQLIIKKGALVHLHGAVLGNIKNLGGELHIY